MRDYRKILAWQKADDLTVAVYEATKTFPKNEVYSLTSQLRRAAYSIPANIAERAYRNSRKDYLHFLYMARGSSAETAYFIHLSIRKINIKKNYIIIMMFNNSPIIIFIYF